MCHKDLLSNRAPAKSFLNILLILAQMLDLDPRDQQASLDYPGTPSFKAPYASIQFIQKVVQKVCSVYSSTLRCGGRGWLNCYGVFTGTFL